MKEIRSNKKRLIAIVLAILLLVMETMTLFSCDSNDSPTDLTQKNEQNSEQANQNVILSFVVEGETYSTITTTGTETIQIPENPSKDGYTFDGWYWDKDVWSKPFTANSLLDAPISSDMSVYAKFTPIAYSISYEMDGGTHNNPATYTIESSFEFADAQKAGYTFLGWYTDATFATPIKSISAGTTGDMNLYAKFKLATYSITYENTKGAENTNPSTYNINSETITFSPLSKDGYTFGGWYVGDTKVMEISKGSTGNLTLTAKWDTIGYSITYHNVTGATNTNPDSYDIEDQPLALLDASKDYYTFKGWYTDAEFNNKVTEIVVGTTGVVDLYAKWETVEYTATFMDGDTPVGTVKFTVETESITPPAIPEHAGYTGAWESYTLGTENITVTAVYTLITYNIVYHNVDGATNSNPSNYDVEDQPLVLFDVSKDYYTFKGWYTDAEFNNKVTEIAVGTTDVVNLYAKWEAIEYTATFMDGDIPVGTVKFTVETNSITEPAVPEHAGYTGAWESYTLGHENITINAVYTLITYNIVYHNVDGATNSNPSNYDVEDQPLVLSDANKEGYRFAGWYSDAEFNRKVTEVSAGTTGIVNLYAKWEALEITITFVSNGGTEVVPLTEYCGTEITAPEDPKREKYSFRGWFLESSDEAYVFSTMPTKDIILYAKWDIYSLTLTYDETVTAVSSLKDITADIFDARCTDNLGRLIEVTASASAPLTAGETVTIRLTASANGITVQKTIYNVKVYSAPTLVFDDTVKYVNVDDGMTATHFSASGTDTFGAATQIKVYIAGEYEVGTFVTVVIESIDPAGNITYGYIENIQAYGFPEITYNKNKTSISVTDTLSAKLFDATAKDSFGAVLTVTITRYSGTMAAGNTVTIRISATDSKGHTTNIDVECKVYGMPVISEAIKTDVRADDTVTPELLGITGTDTYGNSLTVTLITKEGKQTAGTIWTITAIISDVAGNVTTKNFELMVYGAPTICYNRDGVRVEEDATIAPVAILNIIAKDSFGKDLTVTASVKSGSLIAGTYITYTLIATDHLGNTYSIDTVPIGVYDVNDIKFTYSQGMSNLIKITSKGEEFDARASDSFGHLCDITIEAADGYTLSGGKTITLYIVATDKAGNRVLSEAVSGINVYDIPTVTLNQNNRVVDENTDISFLLTAHDSFGEELYTEITIEGEQMEGNTIVVTLTAVDSSGNTVTKQYTFGVLPSEKPFVELYIDGKLWQAFFANDASNYILPMPELSNGFEAVWIDGDVNIYSQTDGVGLIELPDNIQLYYKTYKAGYTPIWTIEQLKSISLSDINAKYCLMLNLDLNGSEWTPIGTGSSPFSGEFDGNGHYISNFMVSSVAHCEGLFGNNNGTIKNLGVENFRVYKYDPEYVGYLGGLVGFNNGTITNCYATGRVINDGWETNYTGGLVGYNEKGTITSCYATGDVIGVSSTTENYAGGLIGYNEGGTIANCYATGDINCDPNEYSAGRAGGLVGYNEEGIIKNCYATGDVTAFAIEDSKQSIYAGGLVGGSGYDISSNKTGTIIMNCYATGNVISNSSYGKCYAGGLIGYNESHAITNCHAIGNVAASSSDNHSLAGGLIGYNEYCTITNCYATGDVSSSTFGYSAWLDYQSHAGGLVGFSVGHAITNCYATGNTTSIASGYNEGYAGGLIGYNDTCTITNCYRYSSQEISGKTKNTIGAAKDLAELHSVVFLSSTLGWSTDDWNLVEDQHPTLKNVGVAN